MNMIPVQSSNISAIGWEATNEAKGIGVLTIVFKNGRTYRYLEVGKVRFDELQTAESVGKVFAAKIRNVYQYEEVGA